MSLINNLKLKTKLLLAFGTLLLLSVFMGYQSWDTMQKVSTYQSITEVIDGVQIDLLKLDVAIKDFIFEGYKSTDFYESDRSDQVKDFATGLANAREALNLIQESDFIKRDSSTQRLLAMLFDLEVKFSKVITLFKARGFKDFGLEGQLRTAIHNVENSSFPFNKADMLMLRRHEKDFFLRRDLKYQDEFNKKANEFITSVAQMRVSPAQQKIIQLLKDYQEKFNEAVSIDVEIGLLEKDGLKKALHEDLAKIHSIIETLRSTARANSARFRKDAYIILFVLFMLQLVAGISMASLVSTQVTRSARQLRDAIQKFAEGVFPDKLEVNVSDETEETKAAFNQLLDRIHAARNFSQQLGSGQLDALYDVAYRNDSLAQSLIKMQGALADAAERQRVIQWTNYGAAQLNELLKKDHQHIQSLGDSLLKMLIQYLSANQGALYITTVHDEELTVERISTYAYDKKRFVEERVSVGQGLVGQCLQEKEAILITEVPKNYARITSGLGEAVPGFIMIMPLLFRNEIVGVLEIASFHRHADYQIQFLEKITENIGSILYNKKMTTETSRLLEEARHQAQQLATQEEEIRQNAEEMQAIQEQLSREKKLLEEENLNLKQLLRSQLQQN